MITVDENIDSPKITTGGSPSVTRTLCVFSTNPEADEFNQWTAYLCAVAWLRENSLDSRLETLAVANLVRLKSITNDPVNVRDEYRFTASYNAWQKKTVSYQMDTGGETARVRFGTVIDSAGTTEHPTAVDFHGGISYSNGVFDGVDVPVPGASFSIEGCYPFEFLTDNYERTLISYRGCTNLNPCGIFARGELMYLGANITKEAETSETDGSLVYFWRIRHNLKASPNVTGLTNAGTLRPIDKFGHDVYWVHTVKSVDSTTNRVTQVPISHYSIRPATCQMLSFAPLFIPKYKLRPYDATEFFA